MHIIYRLLFTFSVATCTGEAIEIPLSDVWSIQMPGTQNVSQSEAPFNVKLMVGFRKYLGFNKKHSTRVTSGFVVPNQKSLALIAADATFSSKLPPKKHVPQRPFSLIFFAGESTAYVAVERIAIKDHEITLSIGIRPHATLDLTSHFALIPLPQLEPGVYAVRHDVRYYPMDGTGQAIFLAQEKLYRDLLSGPHSFEVR